MRLVLVVMALTAVTACGKSKQPAAAAYDQQAAAPTSGGFVEFSFDDDEDMDDLDDLMGSELMQSYAECSDLMRLEPAAMMGKLDDGQINCLEDSLVESDRQTYKRKVSLVLMADAWAKGEAHRWDSIVKRHLEEIDRSDPDLCYKYALHLWKKGPEHATDSIRWADVALENRMRWKGDTHVSRVYSLLRIKARAAESNWVYLEQKYIEEPSEQISKARDDARNQTKTFAREWLEYARSSGKDETIARAMCESAAGTKEFCEVS